MSHNDIQNGSESLYRAVPCVVDDDGDDHGSVVSSAGPLTKTIQFDDSVVTIEYVIDETCGFNQQSPQRCDGETTGPIRSGMKDPHSTGRSLRSLTALAHARQRAIDLASGKGNVVPLHPGEDMSGEEWTDFDENGVATMGARMYKDETRLPVLLWGALVVSKFVTFKDGASYGRLHPIPFALDTLMLSKGVSHYKPIMNKFEHWGLMPKELQQHVARNRVTSSTCETTLLDHPVLTYSIAALTEMEADRQLSKPALAASRKHIELIRSWLIDTGCGHDLVSRKDVKKFEARLRHSLHPLTFNTANGRTTAIQQALLHCKELKEDFDPMFWSPPLLFFRSVNAVWTWATHSCG